jgi:hypothetical protein
VRPPTGRRPDPRAIPRTSACIRPSRPYDPGGIGHLIVRHRFSGPPGRTRYCDRCGLPEPATRS